MELHGSTKREAGSHLNFIHGMLTPRTITMLFAVIAISKCQVRDADQKWVKMYKYKCPRRLPGVPPILKPSAYISSGAQLFVRSPK